MPPRLRFTVKKRKGKPPAHTNPEGLHLEPTSSLSAESTHYTRRGTFPFQKLPPELRNRVYRYVFVSDDYIGTVDRTRPEFLRAARSFLNLNFLLSCSQVRSEASGIFYAENGFEFFYAISVTRFLQGIGKQNRELITKLRYNHRHGVNVQRGLKMISDCLNLRQFEIRLLPANQLPTGHLWDAPRIANGLEVLRGSPVAMLDERHCVVHSLHGEDSTPSEVEQERVAIENHFNYVREVFTERVEDFGFELPIPNPDLQVAFVSRATCDRDTASSS